MMKAAFLAFVLLAGLDVAASLKPDSATSALSANSGDESHKKSPAIKLTYALDAGGSVEQVQNGAAQATMRREPLGAMGGAQHTLASDLVNLLQDVREPNGHDIKKACTEARAMLAARHAAGSSTIDTAVLLAAGNISVETLAAEADPCKGLEDHLQAAMEGHVRVNQVDHVIEVPANIKEGLLTNEEQLMKNAMRIFLGCCGGVGFFMLVAFFGTIYHMKFRKGSKKAAKKTGEEGFFAPLARFFAPVANFFYGLTGKKETAETASTEAIDAPLAENADDEDADNVATGEDEKVDAEKVDSRVVY